MSKSRRLTAWSKYRFRKGAEMYQKLVVVGNLGRDPELRYTPHGSPFCTLSVAVNRKDKAGEEWAIWFGVTVWGSLAEACNEHLAKGRQVLVEGELRADHASGGPRIYTRGDGTVGSAFEITADAVRFLAGGEPEEPEEEVPF